MKIALPDEVRLQWIQLQNVADWNALHAQYANIAGDNDLAVRLAFQARKLYRQAATVLEQNRGHEEQIPCTQSEKTMSMS